MVSYSDAAYECDPDPECCDNGGQNACCDEGPNKDKKDYCPATSENGCCQYGEECYDGNKDPAKCSACYGGTWHSGWQCEGGECVPEASTLVLLATGLLCLAGYVGLKRRKTK